jgi:hypothetical protein
MAACGRSSKAFRNQIDGQIGEVRAEYLGTLPASPDELIALVDAGAIPGTHGVGELYGHQVLRLDIEASDLDSQTQTFEKLSATVKAVLSGGKANTAA